MANPNAAVGLIGIVIYLLLCGLSIFIFYLIIKTAIKNAVKELKRDGIL